MKAEIYFEKLSDAVSILSLCTECPQLTDIKFIYFYADIENEKEEIDYAIKEFRRKFGFIGSLTVCNHEQSKF